MYALEIDEKLLEKFRKLKHKDSKQLAEVSKKVNKILEDPHHFEHLELVKSKFHRAHVDGSFVLIYSIDDDRNIVTLHEYDHHDNIYMHPHIDN